MTVEGVKADAYSLCYTKVMINVIEHDKTFEIVEANTGNGFIIDKGVFCGDSRSKKGTKGPKRDTSGY